MWFFGRAREGNSRARDHRLDEPTRLSLGMVASLQSPLPFTVTDASQAVVPGATISVRNDATQVARFPDGLR